MNMLDKTKKKIASSLVGRKLSEEHKRKIRENNPKYWLGKKRNNPKYIEKLRKAHLGQVAWNKGLKLPQFGGDKASAWKGDRVGYGALHEWVRKVKGTPSECEFCGKKNLSSMKIHWANKSGKYKRDVSDWIRLCVRCHHLFDKERKNNV